MDLVKIIKEDYSHFPDNQTYSIYDENIHFKDKLYDFYGLKKYQKMIGFLTKFFANLHLELHNIDREEDQINTRWTMSWNSPLPWQPFVSVSGTSELKVKDNLIVAHYDYWDCSVWDVVKQHFVFSKPNQ